MAAKFVISLDFELLWGVRDHADRRSYGQNVLGARIAIPHMLAMFVDSGLRVTWATVGFLFCESKDEMLASSPQLRPSYVDGSLSSYRYFDEVGENERSDPYYFAPSLIEAIRQAPGQDIGTHTLSHYCCLEDGQTLAQFEADIAAAVTLAQRRGIQLRSIVFPRNQFNASHVAVCGQYGITHFCGNPTGWAYKAGKGSEQTRARRALRLVDAYSGLLGSHAFDRAHGHPVDVPASRFLRPNAGRLAPLHPAHLATIKRGMTAAAQKGAGYHLWWHPHNFGLNLEENLRGLAVIIRHFKMLQDQYGMQSHAMGDLG